MEKAFNKPVDVLQVEVYEGGVKRWKMLKATALPMALALDWYDRAQEIDAHMAGAEARSTREILEELVDFVASYNEHWPAESIAEAPPGAVVEAFYILRDLNDPLAEAKRRQQAEQDRGIQMLQALGGLNNGAMERLAKRASEAATLSEKNSG